MHSSLKSARCHSVAPGAPRLLDQVRERIRYLHYSLRTEDAYVHWIGPMCVSTIVIILERSAARMWKAS